MREKGKKLSTSQLKKALREKASLVYLIYDHEGGEGRNTPGWGGDNGKRLSSDGPHQPIKPTRARGKSQRDLILKEDKEKRKKKSAFKKKVFLGRLSR